MRNGWVHKKWSTKSGPRKAEPSSSRRRISTQSSQQERSQAFVWCSASLIACLIRTISTYRLPWGRSTSSGSELAKSNNCFPAALGASIWPFSVTHPVSSWLLFVALGCFRLLSAFFFTRSSVFLFPSSLLSQTSARFQHTNHLREHMLWRPTVRISAFKNIPLCHLCRWKRGKDPERCSTIEIPNEPSRNCSSNAPRMLFDPEALKSLKLERVLLIVATIRLNSVRLNWEVPRPAVPVPWTSRVPLLSSPEPFHYETLIDPKNIPFRGPSQQDASDLRIFIEISSKFSISEYFAGECQQESWPR